MAHKDYFDEPKLIAVVVDGCFKLNVREEPNMSSKIVAVLNKGDILEKSDSSEIDGFSQVRLTSGKYGYTLTKYLKTF